MSWRAPVFAVAAMVVAAATLFWFFQRQIAGPSPAFYLPAEIVPTLDGKGAIATARLRWEDPDTHEVVEIARTLSADDIVRKFDEASPRFRLDATVAAFAEVLGESGWSAGTGDPIGPSNETGHGHGMATCAVTARLPSDPIAHTTCITSSPSARTAISEARTTINWKPTGSITW